MGVTFHFLNVGDGDCTIVHFPARTRGEESIPERIMVIDFCHDDDNEYEDVIEYYKTHFRNGNGSLKPIFRFVCTHPHQDHICGLKKLVDDSEINIYNFWDLKHEFEPEDFEHHHTHEEDWETYEKLGDSNSSHTVIRTTREDAPRAFWNNTGDRITVLSPSEKLINWAHYKEDGTRKEKVEVDEMSYALMIKVNDRKVILAGDGRANPCWNDILENCEDEITNVDVLKAAHHGQESGFHEDAIKKMDPALIIFSNDQSNDEKYGAESLYVDVTPKTTILKTFEEGNIIVTVPFDRNKKIIYDTSK